MQLAMLTTRSFLFFAAVVVMLTVGGSAHVRAGSQGVDPQADQMLKRMSACLAGLEQFSARTESTLEVVLRTGEKIQFDTPGSVSVVRPNRMRAVRTGDIDAQELCYDGKTISLYMKSANSYAEADAPATLDEAIDFAREQLGLYAPGGDLLYGDSYAVLMEDVFAGRYVGLSSVGGVACHHLAYRGADVDWQIWIEDGDTPLPRKFVITSKWVTGAPQFTVLVREWDRKPGLKDSDFAFTPPADARRIEFIPPAAETTP